MRTEGKVILITGGSEGVGAACAAELARYGAHLSLVARSEQGLRRAGGPEALVTAGDLTLEETRRRAVASTLEHYGRIDILINNAGVGLYQPSWEMPLDEARYLMELNLFAPLALTQLVVPHMRERRSGMIVNVGSIGGKVVLPWLTFYSVTKFALGALTEGQRMELRRDGIQTMLVCPGYVKTNFQKNVRAGQAPEKVVQSRVYAISPEECAAAIRRGIERDARTVVTPRAGWLFILAMRLFPSFVETRMARVNGTA
ncbi:MAG TPA: SDR family NAD(P)-dependent oxidoreductase [Candidatus Acidoferrales bacterium]|nr:SDR family NAD(P)-dependent oxidoreductase [Candidatus Acidoferrales bacterium]